MSKNTIKINEAQLRSVVERVIKEAIGRQDSRLANRFIKQNNKTGGYTSTQAADGDIIDYARRMLGSREDRNGQFEIERSARDIAPLIQKYNAEIKKLQTVYNYLSARQDGNYAPKSRTARTPMPADQKQRMLASRAANAQARQEINNRYGNINTPNYQKIDNGSVGTKPYDNMRNNIRDRVNAVATKSYGMANESIFRNAPDEVDNICANYRRIPQEQMATAAQKVGARLKEYQNIVAQLQGMINNWTESGHLTDTNAAMRAQRDAELKNVGKRPAASQGYSQVAEAVENAIKKFLKEQAE